MRLRLRLAHARWCKSKPSYTSATTVYEAVRMHDARHVTHTKLRIHVSVITSNAVLMRAMGSRVRSVWKRHSGASGQILGNKLHKSNCNCARVTST